MSVAKRFNRLGRRKKNRLLAKLRAVKGCHARGPALFGAPICDSCLSLIVAAVLEEAAKIADREYARGNSAAGIAYAIRKATDPRWRYDPADDSAVHQRARQRRITR